MIVLADVLAAARRIRPYLSPTPVRAYPLLDAAVGHGIRVHVKHENHQPTGAFKVRNALSVVTAMPEAARRRGLVAATRGNHGLGVAYAGQTLGAAVTICVPHGNNPEKNDAMRALGAELVEEGRDYDDAVVVADRLVSERGMTLVHSTNDAGVIAGAGTMTLELLQQQPDIDALVIAVGGGSQAVGAIVVGRAFRPDLPIYAVQAERASAIHDSWHAGRAIPGTSADTFADGLATRGVYEMTFPPLRAGLTGFITVTEAELAAAVRVALRCTHNLVEGAGAGGLAGLCKLGPALAGKRVGIAFSGGNIDERTLRGILTGELG